MISISFLKMIFILFYFIFLVLTKKVILIVFDVYYTMNYRLFTYIVWCNLEIYSSQYFKKN
jgi:hypothetical protein